MHHVRTYVIEYYHMSMFFLSQNSDPMLLPWVQVDKGAIKFILSGANIMCPGLTSPGASLPVDLPEEANVVSTIMYIYACTVFVISVFIAYIRTLCICGARSPCIGVSCL